MTLIPSSCHRVVLLACCFDTHTCAAANAPHIVEFHGLTRAVSTTHLETFLLDYVWGTTAANVRWVDDEHALAVFPCAEAAQALLASGQRDYKVRPYHKASRKALHVAPEGEGQQSRQISSSSGGGI
jgi:hypothetical protein